MTQSFKMKEFCAIKLTSSNEDSIGKETICKYKTVYHGKTY